MLRSLPRPAAFVAVLCAAVLALGADAEAKALLVYPGSFDPFHLGHRAELGAAQAALAARHPDGVDAVVLPNHDAPKHVPIGYAIDGAARATLARIGTSGLPAVSVHAPFASGTDTVDQLLRVKAEHPGKDVYLLLGEDAYAGMQKWRGAPGVLDGFKVIVSRQPGATAALPAPAQVIGDASVEPISIAVPAVRSHDVFLRMLAGRPIEHLVGPRVARKLAEQRVRVRSRGFPVGKAPVVRVVATTPARRGPS